MFKKIIILSINYIIIIKNFFFFNKNIIAYYNLSKDLIGFNFVEYCCLLEITRIKKKKNKIKLIITDPNDKILAKDNFISHNKNHITSKSIYLSNRIRFFNICLMSLKHFPKIEFSIGNFFFSRHMALNKLNTRVCDTKNIDYILEHIHNDYNSINQNPFLFENSDFDLINSWIKKKKLNRDKIVTLTLRNQPLSPKNNTEVSDWIKFYDYLLNKGYQPIILDDLDNIDTELGLRVTCEIADSNLSIRNTLYKSSLLNYVVGNGFATSITLYDASWILFKERTNDKNNYFFEREHIRENYKNFDAKKKYKKYIINKPNFDRLKLSFEEFERNYINN
jgi:hypothetical protein